MTPKPHRLLTLILLYLRQTSAGLIIYQPVFIPFLLARGMNMLDVALLQTAYNIGVLLLDIPTGFFADRFGRKWALAGANSALVIGTVLICIGHSLTVFIVAELFYALAIAMDSGTHSAYLFEWLRNQNRENEYYRYDALGTFIFLCVGAVGTLIAGYFAERDLLTPVILTIGLTAIGIPAACFLPERQSHLGRSGRPPTTPSSGDVKTTRLLRPSYQAQKDKIITHDLAGVVAMVKDVLYTPGLRWAVGITVIWFWSRQYINLIISQPYFKSIGLHYRHFGLLYSILTLSSGCIALFSRRIIQRPDLRLITALGMFCIPASFAIMGFTHSTPGLAGFFLFAVPYGLCTAVTNTLLNRQFSHHAHRATFLSIVDVFWRIVASALALVLGWMVARYDASSALIAAAALTTVSALVLLPGVFKFAKEAP